MWLVNRADKVFACNRDSWKAYEGWETRKAKLGYIVVVRKISGGEMPGGASTGTDAAFVKSASTPSEQEG